MTCAHQQLIKGNVSSTGGSYKPARVYAQCRLPIRLGLHAFKWEQKIKSTETRTVINIDNSRLHLNAEEKAAFSNEVER